MDRKNVTLIALTGGPASGKSSVLKRLRKHPASDSANIMFMEETATAFFRDRPAVITELDRSILLRQFYILRTQLFAEDILMQNTPSDKPTVLIADRGALDIFAFLSDEEIDAIGRDTLEELWTRYDHVIHLKGNYSNFLRDDETARLESNEAAHRASVRKSYDVWSKCPSFTCISQQETIEEKVRLVIDDIHRYLGREIFL